MSKNIDIASLNHTLSELKKHLYDNEVNKVIDILNNINVQLNGKNDYCERCNAKIDRIYGAMCESCCLDTGWHQQVKND